MVPRAPKPSRSWCPRSRLSIVCSTREIRLAQIVKAINEVAASVDAEVKPDLADLAARLADIWAMIAELDPALAARLRSYHQDGS